MNLLKQIVLFVSVLGCAVACKTDVGHDANASAGNINEVSIVISDVLWNGEVGDSLRKRLAAPLDGLSQEEPLFTLNQFNDTAFEGDLTKGRNIIVVRRGEKADFSAKQNTTCKPQNLFTITGKTIDDLLRLIDMHYDEIVTTIRRTEIAENQKRNQTTGLMPEARFEKQYGISIKVPVTYKAVVGNESFTWLKKDIPGGNTNLLLYTVSPRVIEKSKEIAGNIIKMRDSIGNMYIHGREPGTYMVTEEAYSPYLFMTSFKDKSAIETRGNWEMENDFMNGPFLNYAIRDTKHDCYLVVEGFIYSPSSPKRDLIMELEAIIKSVTFL